MECGDVKKCVDSVDGWVPCKARCPAVVSPGHFSLLKSSQNHFQLPARWFGFGLRLGNHFHQSAIHCSTLQGRGSLMAKVSNQFPEKIHMEKNRSSGLLACLLIHRLTNPMWDSHNTRRSTGWPCALPSHGSKTQFEKTCTTTMLLQKSGQKSFNFF